MTTTVNYTLQGELDRADPNTLADTLRLIRLGKMIAPLKRTFTGLTAASSFDLTTIDGTGETAGVANPNRLPVLIKNTLRVTAVGTAATGARSITDAGGTASATLALISDDGKTVTFEGTVTAFIIEYMPRSNTDITSAWPPST